MFHNTKTYTEIKKNYSHQQKQLPIYFINKQNAIIYNYILYDV